MRKDYFLRFSIEFSFKSNGTGDGPTFKIPAKAGAVYYAVLHKTNDLTSVSVFCKIFPCYITPGKLNIVRYVI